MHHSNSVIQLLCRCNWFSVIVSHISKLLVTIQPFFSTIHTISHCLNRKKSARDNNARGSKTGETTVNTGAIVLSSDRFFLYYLLSCSFSSFPATLIINQEVNLELSPFSDFMFNVICSSCLSKSSFFCQITGLSSGQNLKSY